MKANKQLHFSAALLSCKESLLVLTVEENAWRAEKFRCLGVKDDIA
jgi:hypothetical protein